MAEATLFAGWSLEGGEDGKYPEPRETLGELPAV